MEWCIGTVPLVHITFGAAAVLHFLADVDKGPAPPADADVAWAAGFRCQTRLRDLFLEPIGLCRLNVASILLVNTPFA